MIFGNSGAEGRQAFSCPPAFANSRSQMGRPADWTFQPGYERQIGCPGAHGRVLLEGYAGNVGIKSMAKLWVFDLVQKSLITFSWGIAEVLQ